MSAQSASVEYSQLEDVNPLADWVRDVQTFVPDYPLVLLAEVWFEIDQWVVLQSKHENWIVEATINGAAICVGNSEVH